MKKILLSLSILASTVMVKAQSFSALYDFALVTTTTGVTDPSIVPLATGITFGSFSAVGTPTNPNASGLFSFTGWPVGAVTGTLAYSTMTASINQTKYYEVTIAPQSGFQIDLNTLSFTSRRSSTGIRSYAVRSSINSYSSNLPAIVTNTILSVEGSNEFFINQDPSSTTSYTGNVVNLVGTTITTPTTLRIYAWNSEATGGSFAIDNVVFTGTATAISTTTCASSTLALVSNTNILCYGLTNGAAEMSASVNGPFTYTWMPSGGNTTTATGLSAGLYTCVVTNSCGAVTNQTVMISQPSASLSLTLSHSPILCNGGIAAVSILTNGGTPAYSVTGSYTVTAGNYTYSVVDANGCTASQTISVSNPSIITTNNNAILCPGQSITVGTSTYSALGTYTNVLTSVNGCDSIVISNITYVTSPDASVNLNGLTLSSNQNAAMYQWVDCNNGNAAIPSATNQAYTASGNGSYAVIVTLGNNCSVTSTCTAITTVGLNNAISASEIKMYPNPTNGVLTITMDGATENALSIEITNALGQTVVKENANNQHATFNIQHLPMGVYYVKVNGYKPVKLIKK